MTAEVIERLEDIETSELEVKSPTADPSDLVVRNQLFRTHPVKTRWFQIATPPIRSAFTEMCHVVASGAPCCAFVAFPRVGKSSCCAYCKQRLEEAFPGIPCFRFHANHEDTRSMATRRLFFRDLLQKSLGVEIPLGTKKDLQQLLVRTWWGRARESDSDTIVLLADEMQALSADHYSWLIDITNDLHNLNTRVITILFGQPQLIDLRDTLRRIGRGDILGRFMTRIFPFEGITTPTELQTVMNAYDDPTELEYPEGSGWAFTRFFLPKAYSNGFRLANQAADCWSIFQELGATALSASHLSKLSIGMEWIAGTFQYLLFHSTDADHLKFKITLTDWREAVRSTGWVKSLSDIHSPHMADELWKPK
jgi:hypothetical protein